LVLSSRRRLRRLNLSSHRRKMVFTCNPFVTKALDKVATHQTPQITEGFQVFQKDRPRNYEKLACSRTRPAEAPPAEISATTTTKAAEPPQETLTTKLVHLPEKTVTSLAHLSEKTATTFTQLPEKTASALAELPQKALEAVMPSYEWRQHHEAACVAVGAVLDTTIAASLVFALFRGGGGGGGAPGELSLPSLSPPTN
jgi:hypothetical protein